MTPAARYAAAITVLDLWLAGMPVEKALTGWARGARYAGSKDRAAVRDHLFDILRRKGSCAALGGGGTGRGFVLGLLRLTGQDPAEIFTGAGYAPDPLTGAEAVSPDLLPDPSLDIPDWLHPALASQYGSDLPPLIAALGQRAPVFLRINQRKTSRAKAVAALSSAMIEARVVKGCETALEVLSGQRKLRQASAYLEGLVELQDLSVQRACAAVDWPGQGRILDYCAGGGGKALAIAARSDAEVTVHDARPERMADLPARAARAGVRLMQQTTDALPSGDPFDLVLTDVPCSGSGTWRRDPEAKWRLTPDRLAELQALQRQILQLAAGLVRPGGRLVYMTCSLLRAENQDQIEAFLARQSGWVQTARHVDTPLTASDGFFMAELTQTRPAA
ncbi:RsmB/NOP family class I SAM-dependent RNA methyltransferase [Rhodophyticola sp. CCM32]|uniref:RsmB/NOP family class I SAM-dependent RNA methyltransferase n=1 Tax=Rhodophyticola sp. CCM32 TaxID=2916397 RepID=UPI00107F2836|nr:RsmB/NOP family class I SAM-dependent RNA methyltransferase [Rhodophyticola sp. CCM32]QBY00397.1 RsmB/NOP family class I SAM-dependent RNA methyltransferase [Rhodophyticola sp. CCM32]